MVWEETEPGVYRAELGGSEKIYQKVAGIFAHLGREHYRVHCVCPLDFGPGFQGRDAATALKEAWRTLRAELPTLSVAADGPTHKVYKVLDAKAEQDWLDQTFFVEPDGTTSDEVLARPPPARFPSIHFLPSSSEVVFLCSHWRIDAVGNNWVLDRLFALLANPSSPAAAAAAGQNGSHSAIASVSPALEEACGAPDPWTPEQEAYARDYIRSFREDSFPNDRMRYKGDITTPPGPPARQTIIFDPASTAALVAACRNPHGISVTAAVHSALGQAVFALADDAWDGSGEKRDYTCATSINLRPKLRPPYNTQAHAAQTYVMGVACRVRRDRSFVENAKALTQHYKDVYNDDRVLQSLRAIYKFNSDATPVQQKKGEGEAGKAGVSAVERQPQPAPVAAPPPPSGITISSLGIVDKYLTGEYLGKDGQVAVRVREYHFGIDMMTRQMIMYVGTFRGKLQLSISYNTAYYEASVPLDVLGRVKDKLEKGLGLQLAIL